MNHFGPFLLIFGSDLSHRLFLELLKLQAKTGYIHDGDFRRAFPDSDTWGRSLEGSKQGSRLICRLESLVTCAQNHTAPAKSAHEQVNRTWVRLPKAPASRMTYSFSSSLLFSL